jgi:hypothetical protein
VDQLQIKNAPGSVIADNNGQNHVSIISTNIRRLTIGTFKLPPGLAGKKLWVVACNGKQEKQMVADKAGHVVLNIPDEEDFVHMLYDIFAHVFWRFTSA